MCVFVSFVSADSFISLVTGQGSSLFVQERQQAVDVEFAEVHLRNCARRQLGEGAKSGKDSIATLLGRGEAERGEGGRRRGRRPNAKGLVAADEGIAKFLVGFSVCKQTETDINDAKMTGD